MTPDALSRELDRDPFVPLRLHLADGRKVDIQNPALCVIARLALYFFRVRPRTHIAEDVEVISLRHIVSIELLDAPVS
jgi:hypothetical protein